MQLGRVVLVVVCACALAALSGERVEATLSKRDKKGKKKKEDKVGSSAQLLLSQARLFPPGRKNSLAHEMTQARSSLTKQRGVWVGQ